METQNFAKNARKCAYCLNIFEHNGQGIQNIERLPCPKCGAASYPIALDYPASGLNPNIKSRYFACAEGYDCVAEGIYRPECEQRLLAVSCIEHLSNKLAYLDARLDRIEYRQSLDSPHKQSPQQKQPKKGE